jgi:hypothetical protein
MSTATSRLPAVPSPVAIGWSVGVPAVVGVVALVDGYPLPETPGEAGGVLAGALVLAVLGALAGWGYDRGLRVAPGVVAAAVLGAVVWALLAPGVGATRVADAVVLAGTPVLSRFVGAASLVVVAAGCVTLLEASVRDVADAVPAAGGGRLTALGWGVGLAVGYVAFSFAPSLLLGDAVTAPPLLGFGAVGGVVAGTVVGYLWLRHRLLAPLAVLAVVATAAAVSVTAGGSPRGFPLAWLVWAVPGLALGVGEVATRWIRGRLTGGE